MTVYGLEYGSGIKQGTRAVIKLIQGADAQHDYASQIPQRSLLISEYQFAYLAANAICSNDKVCAHDFLPLSNLERELYRAVFFMHNVCQYVPPFYGRTRSQILQHLLA